MSVPRIALSATGTSMSLLVALVGALLYLVTKAYRSRKVINDLRKQGLPMPPFSWIAGHMLVIKECLEDLPVDAVFNYTARRLSLDFPKHHMFYLDFWPISTPFLVVANPFAASQITQQLNARKPDAVESAFQSLAGGPNLITMPTGPWKKWRSIFSPGFSPAYMLEQVPKMIDKAEVFCQLLREKAAQGTVFQLEEATFRLTIDVIGLISLDSSFDYQTSDSEFPATLRSLIEWATFGDEINPLKRWNPYRPFISWYYGRRLDTSIHAELEKRFAERKQFLQPEKPKDRKVRSIVSLALDSYMTEHPSAESSPPTLDPTFKTYATAQLRLFLVAGHDTTSSAMTYTFHLLHTHPAFLARVRAEHDKVFGRDPAAAAARLSADPTLLNQLPLTTAAIKESLRLFPPAGGIRMGAPDIVLTAEDGTRFPTDGCSVWVVHEAVHRNPALWPRANEYLPERWLVGEDDYGALQPKEKGAWRPFEIGPRNCIGQTLALTEIKTLLVMTLRSFDIKPAYDEWDEMYPKRGVKLAMGERAYQVSGGGGGQHPAERYPCRVSVRE
ncbi:Cytochrome P450 monooxygenase aflN [Lasiodiplodia hormozganensis]|uniref:Cytochrome P450 monooxygenase aflN n=1 Tax=Lasiodiplodia hormozganensis TaxID=869390 RepID=A0AA39Y4U8_9PEZI|nr:Cytochrome P450 monooxygenase aflN [Lasiodiplodia hormozganensis]